MCNVCHRIGHKIFATQIFKNAESPMYRKFVKQRKRKTSQTNSVFATFKADHETNRKYIVVSGNNKSVRFQFGTALYSTLISQSSWKSLGKPCLSATELIARCAFGDQIHLTSMFTCNVTFQVTTFPGVCYLAKKSELNLIGRDWIERLNLFEISL